MLKPISNPHLPKIAKDLDMVHFPYVESVFDHIYKETGILINPEEIDRYDFTLFLEERAGFDKKTAYRFLSEAGDKYFETYPPYDGAVEAFNKIAQRAETHVVTARCAPGSSDIKYANAVQQTHHWLDSFGYKYEKSRVHFRMDKLACMQEHGIELIVEDHPGNSYEIGLAGKKVILIDRKYNQDLLHPQDIHRFDINPAIWKALLACGQIKRAKTHRDIEDLVIEHIENTLHHT